MDEKKLAGLYDSARQYRAAVTKCYDQKLRSLPSDQARLEWEKSTEGAAYTSAILRGMRVASEAVRALESHMQTGTISRWWNDAENRNAASTWSRELSRSAEHVAESTGCRVAVKVRNFGQVDLVDFLTGGRGTTVLILGAAVVAAVLWAKVGR